MGPTGPKTTVRGNQIRSRHRFTVVATMTAIRDIFNCVLVVAGLVIGVALGVPID